MRNTFVKLALLLACASSALSQSQINPNTQIKWPLIGITGADTPITTCTGTNYGQPFQRTDVTPNKWGTCGADGWQYRGTGGSISSFVDPTTINFTAAPYNGSPWGSTTTTGTTSAPNATSMTVGSCSTFVAGNGVYIAGGGGSGSSLSWNGTANINSVVSCSGTTMVVSAAIPNQVTGAVVQHDETNAMNALLTAVQPLGAAVYFPNAAVNTRGVYLFNGPRQDTSGANAVIKMPTIPNYSADITPIEFVGGIDSNYGTPILATSLTTSGANFIGGYDPVGGGIYVGFTNVGLFLKNITISTPWNANVTAVNGSFLLNLETDHANATANPPTASSIGTVGVGFIFPTLDNNVWLRGNDLDSYGYGTGVIAGEHTNITKLAVANETNGIVFDVDTTGSFTGDLAYARAITVEHMWCGPVIGGGSAPSLVTNCIKAGSHATTINVTLADYEGVGTLINDPSNLLHGYVNYNLSATCPTNATVSGASNLTLGNLKCSPGGVKTATVGAVTPNHLAVINAVDGSIKDGGTVPTSGGTFPGTNGLVCNTSTTASRTCTVSDTSSLQYAADTGVADAYVVTLSPAVAAYSNGLTVKFLPSAANATTTPTLAVNGLTAATIIKGGSTALAANDLTNTAVATVVYKGTQWQLQNPQTSASSPTFAATSPIQVDLSVPGTVNYKCPTCSVGSGTAVNNNGGTSLGTSQQDGFLPYVCSDTSGSGTAQVCTTATSFTPQAGNCFVYKTTTANSGTGLTVNANSLGAKSVAIPSSTGWSTTLSVGIIPANKPLLMCYDGTNLNVDQTGTVASASTGVFGTFNNVTTSRVINTVYQNTTGFPLLINLNMGTAVNNGTEIKFISDSSATPTTQVTGVSSGNASFGLGVMIYAVVKPGDYYQLPTSAGLSSIGTWTEIPMAKGSVSVSAELSGSRVTGTAYQNTSGSLMLVQVELSGASGTAAELRVDTSSTPTTVVWSGTIVGLGGNIDFLIPVLPGEYYKVANVSGTATIQHIREITWSGVTATKTNALSNRSPGNSVINYIAPYGKSLWSVPCFQSSTLGSMNGYYDALGQGENISTALSVPVQPTTIFSSMSGGAGDTRQFNMIVNGGGVFGVRFDNGGSPTAKAWYEWVLQ